MKMTSWIMASSIVWFPLSMWTSKGLDGIASGVLGGIIGVIGGGCCLMAIESEEQSQEYKEIDDDRY